MGFGRENPDKGAVQAEGMKLVGGKRVRGILAEGSVAQPLVTVITAAYNAGQLLAGCIESVARQDYANIEHIVMDGGSTDGTVEVLQRYDSQLALWRSERDAGIYDAWNKGLSEARGDWICFLGADDEFLPNAISAYMRLASIHPEAEYLSSRIKVVHPSGYVKILGSAWSWKTFSRVMCMPHVGSMHHRRLFDRLGVYDTSYRIVGDYEFLLRAGKGLGAAYMPDITVMMRAGGVGSSREGARESARAKIATGKRNRLLTKLELKFEEAISHLRPLVRFVLKRLGKRTQAVKPS